MRTKTIIAISALLPILFSCAKEVLNQTETVLEVQDPWAIKEAGPLDIICGNKSLTASYDSETKSQIVMNGIGSYASVVWLNGDSFEMYGCDGSTFVGVTNYTTSDNNQATATFAGGATIEGATSFYSIYPSSAVRAYGNHVDPPHEPVFCVAIPEAQTATPGGVSAGAGLSFSISDTQEGHLTFKNLVSLVKFKLDGDVVDNVKSVTLHGVSPLAGDFVIAVDGGGQPVFVTDMYFLSFNNKYRSVTLSGNFAKNTDYYIAVAPSTQDSFSMTFYNSDKSQHTTKVSGKIMTLDRSRIKDLGTIDLGDTFTGDPAGSYSPIAYKTHTAGTKAVTLVVVPDGYTSAQMDTYELDAKSAIDALFNTEPYKSYSNYFNVWILKVDSNESGASITDGNGNITTARDCYFRTKWGDGYRDMSSNGDKVFAFVEDNCPDIQNGSHTVDEVAIAIIVNDTRYGGICHTSSSGRSYAIVPTTSGSLGWSHPKTEPASVTAVHWDTRTVSSSEITSEKLSNTGTWRNTFVHEFGGHGFGKLADEYWGDSTYSGEAAIASHSYDIPFGLNISGYYATTPWDDLLAVRATWAESNDKYNRIGKFQGGGTSMFYRWRSERISCMIDNRFYFSTWQRYLIAKRIVELSGGSTPTLAAFKLTDVPDDPVRDGGGSLAPQPIGVTTMGPPHIMPMLPPPVLHTDW